MVLVEKVVYTHGVYWIRISYKKIPGWWFHCSVFWTTLTMVHLLRTWSSILITLARASAPICAILYYVTLMLISTHTPYHTLQSLITCLKPHTHHNNAIIMLIAHSSHVWSLFYHTLITIWSLLYHTLITCLKPPLSHTHHMFEASFITHSSHVWSLLYHTLITCLPPYHALKFCRVWVWVLTSRELGWT